MKDEVEAQVKKNVKTRSHLAKQECFLFSSIACEKEGSNMVFLC
jgi:hypothetical protein